MKKFLILAVAILMVACAPQKQAGPEKTTAQLLEERLDTIQKKGYMA